MDSSEDVTYSKSEKASSSIKEQANIHPYPEWATIQAYYGPGVPLPPSYFPSGIITGHVPQPHVWTPSQPVMPPYGVPYSAIYSSGVVYAHPAVPLVATPLSTQLPSNSSDNMDQSSTKKLKTLDRVTVQVINDNAEVDGEGSVHVISQSVERNTDVSSNSSDDKTADERQLKRERRKQANRESARRSRLRKQAETEELMERYETLKEENTALKSERNQLMEESEKLRAENAALMEKLNGAEIAHPQETVLDDIQPDLDQANSSEDGSMQNNPSSVNGKQWKRIGDP